MNKMTNLALIELKIKYNTMSIALDAIARND